MCLGPVLWAQVGHFGKYAYLLSGGEFNGNFNTHLLVRDKMTASSQLACLRIMIGSTHKTVNCCFYTWVFVQIKQTGYNMLIRDL